MARKTTSTKTTRKATTAKATKTKRSLPMPKAAAPATAVKPAGSTGVCELIIESFPNVPTVPVLLGQLKKRGLDATEQTVGNVRGHCMRVLKVLTDRKRLVVKSKEPSWVAPRGEATASPFFFAFFPGTW